MIMILRMSENRTIDIGLNQRQACLKIILTFAFAMCVQS